MIRAVVGEFESAQAMLAALEAAQQQRRPVLDAYSPYPLPQAAAALAPDWKVVRLWAFGAAVVTAVIAYAVQWWSAARAYPLNTGSRQLNSWPVYILTLFEVAVLAAALAGVAAFLLKAGLPRLNHPAFDIPNFERATQDRFFLALEAPARDAPGEMELVAFLIGQGAVQAHGADL
jgi:hypothetical protein